jgi:peptide-methionine (S)-S-oxide reductase
MNLVRILTLIFCCLAPFSGQAATAVFAGGCFWCMESAYQELPGVSAVVSGFTGGTHPNPTYRGPHDGHYESVEVSYDPAVISFADLLTVYWVNVDPFDSGGQFCDRGESYRPAIFVGSDAERQLANTSRAEVEGMFPGQEVVVPVLDRAKFYPVEEYHQDYYQKNPLRYRYYRAGCGRDRRLDAIWEDTPLREKAAALGAGH